MVRAFEWVDEADALCVIDQTLLPTSEQYKYISTVDELVDAIMSLVVRGAPALGAIGAFGVVLAMREGTANGWDKSRLLTAIDRIRNARPTAVNLAWGVDQICSVMAQGSDTALDRAKQLLAEGEAANRQLSKLGADWILEHCGKQRVSVVTHCNTGALATAGWGTAYGIIHELFDRQALTLVFADETRPLLQGARLTSWELEQDGIPYRLETDGAATSTILNDHVDVAIIGADRIAANGDSANKIGSVALALACQRKNIPFIVAAPYSTVDLSIATGDDIEIEERDQTEVLKFGAVRITPQNTIAVNPAFDITPQDLISAIVTEQGIFEPGHSKSSLADLAT